LDVSEIADYMRGLGFFPSDYQVECLHHELQICGKRKVPFEDLVKLLVNHSQSPSGAENISVEKSLKNLLNSPTDVSSKDIIIGKSQLISILTESAEKIDEKDAEFYFNELFRNGSGKLIEEISLSDFMHAITKTAGNNNFCIAQKL
jgi:Ca2+-binding EF-hand superfamily protein